MRLQTALEILNRSAELQATFPVLLACGYSPLHLATFLAAHLQAAVVPPQDIARCVEELHHALVQFSPHVEPALHDPGVFWIDPSGLIPLYGSLEEWAQGIHTALVGRGFQACVVVGFHRFHSYALARCGVGPGHRTGTFAWVLPDPHTESRWSAKVPLAQLGWSYLFQPSDTPEDRAVLLSLSLGAAVNMVLGFLFFGLVPSGIAFMLARRMQAREGSAR